MGGRTCVLISAKVARSVTSHDRFWHRCGGGPLSARQHFPPPRFAETRHTHLCIAETSTQKFWNTADIETLQDQDNLASKTRQQLGHKDMDAMRLTTIGWNHDTKTSWPREHMTHMTHLMIGEFWTLLMKHQIGSSAWYGSGCLWAPQHHPESSCCFVMPSQAIRASQALSGFTKPSISSMQGLGIPGIVGTRYGKSCCNFQPGTWNGCHFLSTCQLVNSGFGSFPADEMFLSNTAKLERCY